MKNIVSMSNGPEGCKVGVPELIGLIWKVQCFKRVRF